MANLINQRILNVHIADYKFHELILASNKNKYASQNAVEP